MDTPSQLSKYLQYIFGVINWELPKLSKHIIPSRFNRRCSCCGVTEGSCFTTCYSGSVTLWNLVFHKKQKYHDYYFHVQVKCSNNVKLRVGSCAQTTLWNPNNLHLRKTQKPFFLSGSKQQRVDYFCSENDSVLKITQWILFSSTNPLITAATVTLQTKTLGCVHFIQQYSLHCWRARPEAEQF